METECEWWKNSLAEEIHATFREKELKIPQYLGQSPQLWTRRYLVDWMSTVVGSLSIGQMAQHLAVYLLDHYMDNFTVELTQLHLVVLCCLLIAVKFEEFNDYIPRPNMLNQFIPKSQDSLMPTQYTREEYITMELNILQFCDWNISIPTVSHLMPYYITVAVSPDDFQGGEPIVNQQTVLRYLENFTNYFQEICLQDETFRGYLPSMVAVSCIAGSRICLRLTPTWTKSLQLISDYSIEEILPCVHMLLRVHEADKNNETSSPVTRSPCVQSVSSGSPGSDLSTPRSVSHPTPSGFTGVSEILKPNASEMMGTHCQAISMNLHPQTLPYFGDGRMDSNACFNASQISNPLVQSCDSSVKQSSHVQASIYSDVTPTSLNSGLFLPTKANLHTQKVAQHPLLVTPDVSTALIPDIYAAHRTAYHDLSKPAVLSDIVQEQHKRDDGLCHQKSKRSRMDLNSARAAVAELNIDSSHRTVPPFAHNPQSAIIRHSNPVQGPQISSSIPNMSAVLVPASRYPTSDSGIFNPGAFTSGVHFHANRQHIPTSDSAIPALEHPFPVPQQQMTASCQSASTASLPGTAIPRASVPSLMAHAPCPATDMPRPSVPSSDNSAPLLMAHAAPSLIGHTLSSHDQARNHTIVYRPVAGPYSAGPDGRPYTSITLDHLPHQTGCVSHAMPAQTLTTQNKSKSIKSAQAVAAEILSQTRVRKSEYERIAMETVDHSNPIRLAHPQPPHHHNQHLMDHSGKPAGVMYLPQMQPATSLSFPQLPDIIHGHMYGNHNVGVLSAVNNLTVPIPATCDLPASNPLYGFPPDNAVSRFGPYKENISVQHPVAMVPRSCVW